ncbi:MAG: DegV family protein, partial [Oscillospiraceae bacterium]|nr:DegV family protein [Oscillospiraceae bacterium]
MRDFVILTDSCCDLPAQMAQELELEVAPLHLELEGKDYRNLLDGSEIGFEEFYDKVRGGAMGTTSAVSVGGFAEQMRPILEAGKDILCLSFSSGLSTTYQSAAIAAQDLGAEFPEAKIFVVDTLSASLGQGLLVYLCAKEKAAGKSIEQVRDFAEQTKLHLCHWFTVDDLNHLKRGGRISAATA